MNEEQAAIIAEKFREAGVLIDQAIKLAKTLEIRDPDLMSEMHEAEISAGLAWGAWVGLAGDQYRQQMRELFELTRREKVFEHAKPI